MDNYPMTIQQAAIEILKRKKIPMSSEEIAKEAMRQRLITSGAINPIRSLSNTLAQNINNEREPKLVYFKGKNNENLVGLPEWQDNLIGSAPWWEEIKINVPLELFKKLQLAQQARLKPNLEETIIFLLESGLKQEALNIKEEVMKQIEKL